MLNKILNFLSNLFSSNQQNESTKYQPIFKKNWVDKKWLADVFRGLLDNKRSSIINAFWLLTTSDDRLKYKVMELLNLAIKETDLKRLNAEFRQRTSFNWSCNWRNESPYNLILANSTEDEKITVLGLSSFHPNGFFREKAIKELVKFDNRRVFPFLIIRVNDWVPEVRTLCKKLLLENINNHNVPVIIQNNSLEKNKIITCLQNEKISFVRHLLLTYLINENLINNYVIINQILNKEKNAKSKKLLLEYAHEFLKGKAIPIFKTYIFDTQKSVRAISKNILNKYGIKDFAPKYRAALKERKNIIGAIGGISELGNENDVELIAIYLNHSITKVIRESIKCIAKLNYKYIEPKLEIYLAEKRQGISKDSRDILLQNLSSVNSKNIFEIFNKSQFEHVRLYCLKVIFALSKWESIYFILCTLNEDNESISQFSKNALEKWQSEFNRSYSSPSKIEIDRIKNILPKVDEKVRAIMLFSLKLYEKD